MKWLRCYGIIEYLKAKNYNTRCDRKLKSTGPEKLSLLKVKIVYYYENTLIMINKQMAVLI